MEIKVNIIKIMFCKSNYLLLVIGVLTCNFTGFGKNCCPCGKKEKKPLPKEVQSGEAGWFPVEIVDNIELLVPAGGNEPLKHFFKTKEYFKDLFKIATDACKDCVVSMDNDVSFYYVDMKLGYVGAQEQQKIDKIIFTKYDIREPIELCQKHNKCSENGCGEKVYCLLNCRCVHFLCEKHFNSFFEKKGNKVKKAFFCKNCNKILCGMCQKGVDNHVLVYDNKKGRSYLCKNKYEIYYEGITSDDEYEFGYQEDAQAPTKKQDNIRRCSSFNKLVNVAVFNKLKKTNENLLPGKNDIIKKYKEI